MQGEFHQYRITKELAKKYSHVTYLASPMDDPEHQVILKLFPLSLFRFPSEHEKLLSQAQRLKELHHPHLEPLLDMGIEQNQPFVVREYMPNGSLRSHLKKHFPGSLKLEEALSIVLQVGSALACAHEHNIIHGSLHPENILLDASSQAVLTDFHLTNKNDAIIRDQTTKEYAFCYLAPEQFAGMTDAKSDQYALGCLAYELITGQVPFAAQSLVSMMGYHSNTEPIPLSEKRADVPPSLEAAILKTLAKDPAKRFFDFSLFLEVIQSALLPAPAFPLSRTVASRRTRRPKAGTFLSSLHQITASSSPAPELFEAETMQQLEEHIAVTTKRGDDSDQRDMTVSVSPETTNEGSSNSNTDRGRKPLVGEISFAESQHDLDQTEAQEDDADVWLTNLFAEQESHDLPATGSASLEQEQHESGREKKYEMIPSLDRDRPVRRRTQPNRGKVFGLVLLCFVIIASGTYAAVFLLRTSKPDRLVRPTTNVSQVLIPVQKSISPAQIATPTATVQPRPQITTIPTTVVPTVSTPTPIPRPTVAVRQILAIDDSIMGTGLNQFNYVGNGWGHCTGGCSGDPYPVGAYNGSNSWDNTVDDYVSIAFNGTQIKFYGVAGPPHGIGAFSIDGGAETMVDFYAPTQAGDTLLYTSPMLPSGQHTLKVRVTGNQSSQATWNGINPDRVDIVS